MTKRRLRLACVAGVAALWVACGGSDERSFGDTNDAGAAATGGDGGSAAMGPNGGSAGNGGSAASGGSAAGGAAGTDASGGTAGADASVEGDGGLEPCVWDQTNWDECVWQ